MNDVEFNYMKKYIARQLAQLLIERHSMSLEQALDTLYNSNTFEKLSKPETGLYYQSPLYVFTYLERELIQGGLL